MKIVGIISSANRQGNTAILVRETLAGASDSGATVEEIYLPGKRIQYCIGCNRCMAEGNCHLDDEFDGVKRVVAAADGIILSSPTYAGGPNAQMKTMIERFGLFERMTGSCFGGKYVIGISTASSMGAAKTARELTAIAVGALYHRGYCTGIIGHALRGKTVSDKPEVLARSRALGKKMVMDIKHRRRYPMQNLAGRSLVKLLLEPMFKKAICDRRMDIMKAVYDNLCVRGVIGRASA